MTLFSGTAIAQGFSFLMIPAITRIYPPSVYGMYAQYVAIAGIISAILTWRYEMAIALPKDDSEAASVFVLTLISALIMSTVTFVAIAPFNHAIAHMLKCADLTPWLIILIFSLLLGGTSSAASYWCTRKKRFKTVASYQASQSGFASGAQLLLGEFVSATSIGLIMGQVAGSVIGILILARSTLTKETRQLISNVTRADVLGVARKYIQLPLHTLSTSFLNVCSMSMLPVALAYFYGPHVAGLALMAQRLLSAPASTITQSIWQVTHAHLPSQEPATQKMMIRRLHRSSSFLFAFPFIAAIILSRFMGTVLGESWQATAKMMPATAIMVYFASVSGCTSYFAAFSKFHAETVVNVVLLLVRVAALVVGAKYLSNFQAVNLFMLASACVYIGVSIYWGKHLGLLSAFMWNFVSSIMISVVLLAPVAYFGHGSLWVSLVGTAVVAVCYYRLAAQKAIWKTQAVE